MGRWQRMTSGRVSRIRLMSPQTAMSPETAKPQDIASSQPPAVSLGWQFIGCSVRGASHERSCLPNQDALYWAPETGHGPPLIVALADGHGSARSFRSHLGSSLAVREMGGVLQALIDFLPADLETLSVVKRAAEARLPQEVVRRWQGAVESHLAEHPFSEAELTRLAELKGDSAVRDLRAHSQLAYGTTLLGALLTAEFLIFLQLGDGDILLVSETGEVTRPFSRDARLIANETTSMCMAEAWREVRLHFRACAGWMPALILMATDGYANSFIDDDAFQKVGSDLLTILRTDGAEAVETNLAAWLREASEAGSGDDITLGLLFRCDVVQGQAADAATATSEDSVAVVEDGEADQPVRLRSAAAIKHEAPREPAKRSRLAYLVAAKPDEPDAVDGALADEGHGVSEAAGGVGKKTDEASNVG